MARIIVFISATKGVGKTHLCLNLATRLAQLGHGTCLFNAAADAAAAHSLFDIRPRFSLKDLIENRVRSENGLIKAVHGIDFFQGCPGMEQLGTLDQSTRSRLHRSFMDFNRYDFFIVDTFPGLSRNVVALCKSSPGVVLVMTSDPRSLTSAYLLLKTLSINRYEGSVMLLMNMSRDLRVARKFYHRFKEAASRRLPITMVPLGTVFYDPSVQNAEERRQPFVSLFPDSDASKCVVNIARHLSDKRTEDLAVSAFWEKLMENLKHPLQIAGKLQPGARQGSPHTVEGTPPESGLPSTSEPENGFGKISPDGLERLERQLSNLSKEVAGIKLTLADVSECQKSLIEAGRDTAISAPHKTETMVLDFETFLKERKKSET